MTTITIGGREFRVGATYAPSIAARYSAPASKPRRLVGWAPGRPHLLKVRCPAGSLRYMPPESWLRWAGDEVQP